MIWDNGRKNRKEWAILTKHQIEQLCWKQVIYARPYKIESVWEILSHLAALSPRGAVIWEVRSKNGQIHYLLGADKRYIADIEKAVKAHGSIEFHDAEETARIPINTARQLKISPPPLPHKPPITETFIRAVLAALSENKSDSEAVVQIILGRANAPSPVPANLSDPNATWLQILLGDVQKASAETRKAVRDKAEQYIFQTAIRIGISGDGTVSRLRNIVSAFKVLETAGVHIHEESIKPDDLNSNRIPWHFPLQLSSKELGNFLLLPAGEDELPGTPGLHPKQTLPPGWYRSPSNKNNDRSFAVSMDTVTSKKLSISPRDSLEHCHLIGPTGSGKSTAMLHLILSDINAGRSVLVLDPKADLVTDILKRIP